MGVWFLVVRWRIMLVLCLRRRMLCRVGGMLLMGDKEKAARAIYEVVVGEGVGVGRDVLPRVELVDRLDHMLEVFGEVAENVYVDSK
jgi:hypothetical protein